MRGCIDARSVYSVIVPEGDKLEVLWNWTGRGVLAYGSVVKQ
jgi:hypothetical protein